MKQAAASTRRFEEGIGSCFLSPLHKSFMFCSFPSNKLQYLLTFFCCLGSPLSILDGIFIAIKDDIDCYPHPTKG